jgi:hypothetical protein
MKYRDFERVFSVPRLNKYLRAAGGDKQKALRLYRYNIKLCQRFYGMLGILEVALRNTVNDHFKTQLADTDWIVTQAKSGFLKKYHDSIQKEHTRLVNAGSYTNDKLLSTLSFGVWTYMFSRHCYRNSGKTLLRIFPNKKHGANQSDIYNELDEIRIFRNRIAHHEPLCFNQQGQIDLSYAVRILNMIEKYLNYLGFNPKEAFYGIEHPFTIFKAIDKLRWV